MSSRLERQFANTWLAVGGPGLESEFRFTKERRWRFDFAHVASHTAVELEGGIWGQGAHTRGRGFEEDCEKYNAAAELGWEVWRLTGDMIGVAWCERFKRRVQLRAMERNSPVGSGIPEMDQKFFAELLEMWRPVNRVFLAKFHGGGFTIGYRGGCATVVDVK